MRLLFDTNVIFDVILQRQPWFTDARSLWDANDNGKVTGFILASTLTDIFYVVRKAVDINAARNAVQTCLDAFEICTVDEQALRIALTLIGSDFEDNLQIACANLAGLDAIVTRDKRALQQQIFLFFLLLKP